MNDQFILEFHPFPKQRPVVKYTDLNINQKINVKANSCGFEWMFIYNSAMCWSKGTLNHIRNEHYPDKLTEKWFWHISHNHGGRHSVLCVKYHTWLLNGGPIQNTLFEGVK